GTFARATKRLGFGLVRVASLATSLASTAAEVCNHSGANQQKRRSDATLDVVGLLGATHRYAPGDILFIVISHYKRHVAISVLWKWFLPVLWMKKKSIW